MIAAGVPDFGAVEFGATFAIALVLGILIWNVFRLAVEEIKGRSQRKISSQVNGSPTKIVASND